MIDHSAAPTIIITGATGLLGAATTAYFLSQGYRVRAVCRKMPSTPLPEPLKAWLKFFSPDSLGTSADALQWICTDLEAPLADWQKLLQDTDYLIHAAAAVDSRASLTDLWTSNVEAVLKISHAAQKTPRLQRLIFISSIAVFPYIHHDQTDETHARQTSPADGYSHSKILAEDILLGAAQHTPAETVIIRPGLIYGFGDRYFFPPLSAWLKMAVLPLLGPRQHKIPHVFAGNLASLMGQIVTSPRNLRGEIFIGVDHPQASKEEFFSELVQLKHGKKLCFLELPSWIQHVAGLSPLEKKFLSLSIAFSPRKCRDFFPQWQEIPWYEALRAMMK